MVVASSSSATSMSDVAPIAPSQLFSVLEGVGMDAVDRTNRMCNQNDDNLRTRENALLDAETTGKLDSQLDKARKRVLESSATHMREANRIAVTTGQKNRVHEAAEKLLDKSVDTEIRIAHQSADHARVERDLTAQSKRGISAYNCNRARFQALEHALGLSSDITILQRLSKTDVGVARLMFLVTLVGCEFDLLGFCMSFVEYWNLESDMRILARALLMIMPAAYLSIGGYASMQEQTPGAKRFTAKLPGNFEWFHWMPFVRFWLVLKPLTDNDIESVFMANTLSSFTLGSAQIIGIIGRCMMLKFNGVGVFGGLPFRVQLNFCTWLVNWLITVVYFLTPIAQKMKNASAVGAVEYRAHLEFAKGVDRYHEAIKKDLETVGGQHVKGLKAELVKEIESWTECEEIATGYLQNLKAQTDVEVGIGSLVQLDQFQVMDLLKIKKAIYKRVASQCGRT